MDGKARLVVRGLLVAAALLAPASYSAIFAAKSSAVRVEAMTLLNEGVSAYNRGEYPLAIEKLKRASSLAMNSFRANFYLGLSLLADRRAEEAVAALDVALDLEPSNLQAHVAMGDAHLRQGDTDEAMASFARALELRSEYPPGLDGMARVYEGRADDGKAIEFFKRAVASNKGYADAYAHLGRLYLRLDRLDEAVELLQEAVSIRADFAYGYNGLALAYSRLGLRNEAVVAIRKAIELEPNAPEHWTTLGGLELEVELAARAEGSFRKALELDPTFPAAREGLAESARRRGDYDAGLSELDIALADSRMDSDTRSRLVKMRSGIEAEQAEFAAVDAAARAEDAPPATVHRLAALYAGRRQWDRAADTETRAHPEGPARERLAYYLSKAGRYRDAHELYAELAQAAPRAALEVNDGIALAGLGDDAQAIAAYQRALGLDPKEDRAQLYLGNALLRLGRRSDAAAAYRAYVGLSADGTGRERVRRILDQIAPPLPGATAPPAPAATGAAGPGHP